jgi:hypothetical protein
VDSEPKRHMVTDWTLHPPPLLDGRTGPPPSSSDPESSHAGRRPSRDFVDSDSSVGSDCQVVLDELAADEHGLDVVRIAQDADVGGRVPVDDDEIG